MNGLDRRLSLTPRWYIYKLHVHALIETMKHIAILRYPWANGSSRFSLVVWHGTVHCTEESRERRIRSLQLRSMAGKQANIIPFTWENMRVTRCTRMYYIITPIFDGQDHLFQRKYLQPVNALASQHTEMLAWLCRSWCDICYICHSTFAAYDDFVCVCGGGGEHVVVFFAYTVPYEFNFFRCIMLHREMLPLNRTNDLGDDPKWASLVTSGIWSICSSEYSEKDHHLQGLFPLKGGVPPCIGCIKRLAWALRVDSSDLSQHSSDMKKP